MTIKPPSLKTVAIFAGIALAVVAALTALFGAETVVGWIEAVYRDLVAPEGEG